MNIELNNTLKELVKLAEQGKNPIPIELIEKQIKTITQLKQQCNHINFVMTEFFKYDKITNDISEPVMNDNIDLITVLNMRLDCYEKLRDLFVV